MNEREYLRVLTLARAGDETAYRSALLESSRRGMEADKDWWALLQSLPVPILYEIYAEGALSNIARADLWIHLIERLMASQETLDGANLNRLWASATEDERYGISEALSSLSWLIEGGLKIDLVDARDIQEGGLGPVGIFARVERYEGHNDFYLEAFLDKIGVTEWFPTVYDTPFVYLFDQALHDNGWKKPLPGRSPDYFYAPGPIDPRTSSSRFRAVIIPTGKGNELAFMEIDRRQYPRS